MTNFANIQQLKNLTHCTTPQALQLLKQANNDVAKAEQLFHEQNIAFIQQQADCERELAEKFYQMYDFEVTKAIEQADAWIRHDIRSRCVITLDEDTSTPNGHGLLIFAENEQNQMIRERQLLAKTYVLIPFWAGNLLKTTIKSFGFYQWRNEECNYFSLADVDKLIENLATIQTNDEEEKNFYDELKNWLIECKPFAHHLIFEDLLS